MSHVSAVVKHSVPSSLCVRYRTSTVPVRSCVLAIPLTIPSEPRNAKVGTLAGSLEHGTRQSTGGHCSLDDRTTDSGNAAPEPRLAQNNPSWLAPVPSPPPHPRPHSSPSLIPRALESNGGLLDTTVPCALEYDQSFWFAGAPGRLRLYECFAPF